MADMYPSVMNWNWQAVIVDGDAFYDLEAGLQNWAVGFKALGGYRL